jgi:NTE family protein
MATGLVLTGGGLRGICAQAGALVALERRGYRFDAIIGTSAGAIVGALYASHGAGSAEVVAERISGADREDYLDDISLAEILVRKEILDQSITGLHRGTPLLTWLRQNLAEERIEDCPIPLLLTVTNVSRRFPQVKDAGPLADYARASAAVPGFFEAQEVEGEYYVDGGAANNVPVDELASRRPDLDRFLVLTSLSTPEEPEPDNDFLDDNFPFLSVVERALRAAGEGLALNNLNAGERPVEIFRVEAPDLDLEDSDSLGDCIAAAIENAERQIAEGAIDLTGIRREG